MHQRTSIHLRSWVIGVISLASGLGLYVYDDWTEGLDIPLLRSVLNALEILVMGPGVGVMGVLISEQLILKERRYEERVAQEREARFRFLGKIAASMAHEVRNPLHNIHLLTDELRSSASSLSRELLDRITANIERLDQATLLIYELAKPQRKIDGDGYGPIDLGSLVTTIIAEVRIRHGDAISVEHANPTTPLRVMGRVEGLRIVLHNLIRNAVEAADGGLVSIGYEHGSTDVCMRITNPGTLDPAILTDESASIPHKPGGLGVGISIARHLTALFGGSVEFASSDGVVTTQLRLQGAR